ncbi:hypothetical protein ZYGR_0AK00870 [Zygosaccharomyces rouxii]|uniref:IME2-dependent-signaling protein n=1 Tax=Zygosaccharomyces rouxii TaxID=4956 RepID=A0A1Q3AD89_ZYGRO|nr:hypothetical protein ZYGR_0AK00870 [Zygosaccharomyces rouxii]
MNRDTEFLEDMTGDLARALRNSWSEPQDSKTPYQDSPISTPQCNQYHSHSPGGGSFTSAGSQVTSLTGGSDNTRRGSNGRESPDYHLIKRHYSLMEQPNVGHNRTGTGTGSGSGSGGSVDEDLLQGIMQESVPPLMPAPLALPLRRSSIQEIQKVRHLSNPRSSFSGAPSEEPELRERCGISWVTILANSSPESVNPVLVLQESLKSVNSKFGLCVIHSFEVDSSTVREKGIETVAFDEEKLPELFKKSKNPHSLLMVFMALAGKYDLVCYLSPTCMVLENIDDLLDSEEIGKEIDNDTCVLLTNSAPVPQIIILRPLIDVEMCIREFFTVYGDDCEDKSNKLTKMRDYDVLETLFQDSWSKIATDEYCGTLPEKPSLSESSFPYKMVDLALQKPWITHEKHDIGPLAGRWHRLWLQTSRRQQYDM